MRWVRTAGPGDMVEVLRPCRELARMRSAIADRVARMMTLRLARVVPVRSVDVVRDGDVGIEIVSDYVPGSRLSDILNASSAGEFVIPTDAALHIVRQALGALAALHQSRAVTHGALAPERLIVTSRGHVVIADCVMGLALERLGFGRGRLWDEFQIPMPPGADAPIFNQQSDVAQVAFIAVALLAGRPLEASEVESRLPALIDSLRMTDGGGAGGPIPKALRAWLTAVLRLDKAARQTTAHDAQLALAEALSKGHWPSSAENPIKTVVDRYARTLAVAPKDIDSPSTLVELPGDWHGRAGERPPSALDEALHTHPAEIWPDGPLAVAPIQVSRTPSDIAGIVAVEEPVFQPLTAPVRPISELAVRRVRNIERSGPVQATTRVERSPRRTTPRLAGVRTALARIPGALAWLWSALVWAPRMSWRAAAATGALAFDGLMHVLRAPGRMARGTARLARGAARGIARAASGGLRAADALGAAFVHGIVRVWRGTKRALTRLLWLPQVIARTANTVGGMTLDGLVFVARVPMHLARFTAHGTVRAAQGAAGVAAHLARGAAGVAARTTRGAVRTTAHLERGIGGTTARLARSLTRAANAFVWLMQTLGRAVGAVGETTLNGLIRLADGTIRLAGVTIRLANGAARTTARLARGIAGATAHLARGAARVTAGTTLGAARGTARLAQGAARAMMRATAGTAHEATRLARGIAEASAHVAQETAGTSARLGRHLARMASALVRLTRTLGGAAGAAGVTMWVTLGTAREAARLARTTARLARRIAGATARLARGAARVTGRATLGAARGTAHLARGAARVMMRMTAGTAHEATGLARGAARTVARQTRRTARTGHVAGAALVRGSLAIVGTIVRVTLASGGAAAKSGARAGARRLGAVRLVGRDARYPLVRPQFILAVLIAVVAWSGVQLAGEQWRGLLEPWISRVEPAAGNQSLVRAATAPLPATGSLRVESDPIGARVWLDGKLKGETPLALSHVKSGAHTVLLRHAAGSVRTTVRIEAGKSAEVQIPIYSGWLAVFAPAELQILDGGVVVGTTESGRILVKPGSHALELVNAPLGFRTTRTVEVLPGEVTLLNIDLPPAPLEIVAPPGAEIWLDGRLMGNAPLQSQSVAVGTFEVVMRHPTLGERRQTVTVAYGTTNRIVFPSQH